MLSAQQPAEMNEGQTEPSAESSQVRENEMLKENNRRFVLFPIQHSHLWHSYKLTEAKFWSAEEIELADDLDDFNALPRRERVSVLHIVASMAAQPAANTLLSRLSNEIQASEARAYLGFQIMQAAVHTELSNVLLDMYLNNAGERVLTSSELGTVLHELDSTKMRKKWIDTYILSELAPFPLRMTSLAVFYRMAFTVQAYYAFACRGTSSLPGFVHATAKIYRDWVEYSRFSLQLVLQHFSAPSQESPFSHSNSDWEDVGLELIEGMVREFAAVQIRWVDELLEISGNYLGLPGGTHVDPEAMKEFIRYSGNVILKDMSSWSANGGIFQFALDSTQGDVASGVQSVLETEASKDEVEQNQTLQDQRLAMAKTAGSGAGDGKERTFELSFDF